MLKGAFIVTGLTGRRVIMRLRAELERSRIMGCGSMIRERGDFLSVDPVSANFPMLTSYQFSSNTPIWATDLDGLEANFKSAKLNREQYDDYGDPILNVFLNKDKFGANVGVSAWNQTVDAVEDATNLLFSNKGRNQVVLKYGNTLVNLASVKMKINNGNISVTDIFNSGKDFLSNPENLENLGGGFLTASLPLKFSKLKLSAEFQPGTQLAGYSLSKRFSRMSFAQRFLQNTGKSPEDIQGILNTIDFRQPVREKLFDVGDKIFRYERKNAKSADMHFFTDAIAADKNAQAVGFYDASGYELVTYEVLKPTSVMESTIKSTGHKQYFSTELQKNVKEISRE
jgi:hypothetical protein